MYTPVPGYSHVVLLAPIDRITYAQRRSLVDSRTLRQLRNMVTIAVEAAARQRSLAQLDNPRFHPSVLLHVRAWARQVGLVSRTARVLSLHAQPSGEYHGSAQIGDSTHAFTGKFTTSQLQAFRLLATHADDPAP